MNTYIYLVMEDTFDFPEHYINIKDVFRNAQDAEDKAAEYRKINDWEINRTAEIGKQLDEDRPDRAVSNHDYEIYDRHILGSTYSYYVKEIVLQ